MGRYSLFKVSYQSIKVLRKFRLENYLNTIRQDHCSSDYAKEKTQT